MKAARTVIFIRIKISYKLAKLLMSFIITDQGRLFQRWWKDRWKSRSKRAKKSGKIVFVWQKRRVLSCIDSKNKDFFLNSSHISLWVTLESRIYRTAQKSVKLILCTYYCRFAHTHMYTHTHTHTHTHTYIYISNVV